MKKALVTLSIVAAVALAACSTNGSDQSGSGSASGAGPTQETIKDGVLTIGVEGKFAPYGYHDNSGDLVGFEVEIAKQIAQDAHLTPEFVETQWDSLIAGLDVNKYDMVINNLNPTPERQQKYDFSIPYMVSTPEILVAEDSDIKTSADLAGKGAAQTPSSDYAQVARDLGATIVPTQNLTDSINLVIDGRADGTINDTVTMANYLKEKPDSPVRLIDIPESPKTDSAIMIRKGNTALQEKINASITKGLQDGSFKTIFSKYIDPTLVDKILPQE